MATKAQKLAALKELAAARKSGIKRSSQVEVRTAAFELPGRND